MTPEQWVDDFIIRHVRTRVLDGRPGKVFRDALIKDIGELMAAHSEPAKPAPKREKANG